MSNTVGVTTFKYPGLIYVTQILLLVGKIFGFLPSLSWWWVASPVIAVSAIASAAFLFALTCLVMAAIFE